MTFHESHLLAASRGFNKLSNLIQFLKEPAKFENLLQNLVDFCLLQNLVDFRLLQNLGDFCLLQ